MMLRWISPLPPAIELAGTDTRISALSVIRLLGPPAAASALLFLYGVIYAFPDARRAALQQERQVVEQENRALL